MNIRAIAENKEGENTLVQLANRAWEESQRAVDEYSEYGVGAVLKMEESLTGWQGYSAHNIRLSGIEHAMHAEQLCIFQAIMDYQRIIDHTRADPSVMMVVTTGDDIALNCGHCLQALSAACQHFDTDEETVDVIGVKMDEKISMDGNSSLDEIVDARFNSLTGMIGSTYVSNREK